MLAMPYCVGVANMFLRWVKGASKATNGSEGADDQYFLPTTPSRGVLARIAVVYLLILGPYAVGVLGYGLGLFWPPGAEIAILESRIVLLFAAMYGIVEVLMRILPSESPAARDLVDLRRRLALGLVDPAVAAERTEFVALGMTADHYVQEALISFLDAVAEIREARKRAEGGGDAAGEDLPSLITAKDFQQRFQRLDARVSKARAMGAPEEWMERIRTRVITAIKQLREIDGKQFVQSEAPEVATARPEPTDLNPNPNLPGVDPQATSTLRSSEVGTTW